MRDRKQEILDAAVAIADELGLEAVSMRSVADRVGVTPMALYPHIGGKSALLDAMVGRMGTGLLPAVATDQTWREQLYGLARAALQLTQRHPWWATLAFERPSVAPDAVRVTDAIYQALLAAGVPEPDVPRLERMFSTFVLGYGLSMAGGRFKAGDADPRGTRWQLPEGPLPGHAHLVGWLSKTPDWEEEFTADLADIERLIEAKAHPTGGSPPRGE